MTRGQVVLLECQLRPYKFLALYIFFIAEGKERFSQLSRRQNSWYIGTQRFKTDALGQSLSWDDSGRSSDKKKFLHLYKTQILPPAKILPLVPIQSQMNLFHTPVSLRAVIEDSCCSVTAWSTEQCEKLRNCFNYTNEYYYSLYTFVYLSLGLRPKCMHSLRVFLVSAYS